MDIASQHMVGQTFNICCWNWSNIYAVESIEGRRRYRTWFGDDRIGFLTVAWLIVSHNEKTPIPPYIKWNEHIKDVFQFQRTHTHTHTLDLMANS